MGLGLATDDGVGAISSSESELRSIAWAGGSNVDCRDGMLAERLCDSLRSRLCGAGRRSVSSASFWRLPDAADDRARRCMDGCLSTGGGLSMAWAVTGLAIKPLI